MFGYRTRLFLVALALFAAVAGSVGLFMEDELRRSVLRADLSEVERAERLEEVRAVSYQGVVLSAVLCVFAALLVSTAAALMFSRTMRSLIDFSDQIAPDPRRTAPSGGASIQLLSERLAESIEQVSRERDRLAVVLESMSDAVIAVDARQRVTLFNATAERMLADQLQAVGGQALGLRVTDLLRSPELIDLLDRGREAQATAELALPGAPARLVSVSVTPRVEDAGAVLVLHDVTELRKLETMRRDFVTNVSHELRTPVAVILANSETLLSDDLSDPARARRFIEALNRNADRISRLIADLLDISRLEAGRFALDLEPVSLFGVALHVVDSLEDKLGARAQTVDVDVDIDLLVLADSKAVDQILFNLLDNAIKYAGDGGALTVRASAEASTPDAIRVEVCDDGPGLPPEHRQRIFERFYRVDDGRSRDVGGTGLGLSIVKHLTGAMNGRVGVRPNTPSGSIFWFELPTCDDPDAFDEV
jgi:two-component system phosphate regulon sensor histidine kinase PhoR